MSLDLILWFAYIAAEAFLVGLLIYRRVWRTLPIFCIYCVWDILSNLSVYAITRYYPAHYFRVYFAQTVIDSTLLFCVLVELAWSVLRPLRSSLGRRSLVIVGALVLAVGAAIWPFAAVPSLAHLTSKQGLLFEQLQQTVAILRILFFVALAAGSQFLSISWRDRELQVASGLGFVSFVGVAILILRTHQASASEYYNLNQIAVASYLCCVLYWTVSFVRREAERREFTPQMRSFLLAAAGAARATRVGFEESSAGKSRKPDLR